MSSEATAATLVEALPGAQLFTVPGSAALGHVDSRAAYNERLLSFLDAADGTVSRRAVMLPGTMQPGGALSDPTVGTR